MKNQCVKIHWFDLKSRCEYSEFSLYNKNIFYVRVRENDKRIFNNLIINKL